MDRFASLLCAASLISPAFADSRPESLKTPKTTLEFPVAFEKIPAATRDAMTKVMATPTMTAIAPAEEFVAHAEMYQWLLDHPDRASQAWRKLGVEALEIKEAKEGRFTWRDAAGSEMVWRTVAQGPKGRVWFAEGKYKPGPLIPSIPVSGVAILNHSDRPRESGDSLIRHQIEIFLHSDSRAATWATKMLGEAAPKMAKDGAEQMLMFFSGIARYTHNHPDKAKTLFTDKPK